MLFDDLVEARVVDLDKLGEVVDISDDITEVLLEQHKLLLARSRLVQPTLIQTLDNLLDLPIADGNAPLNLHGLNLLLRMDLVELVVQLLNKASLVLLSPLLTAIVRISLWRPSGVLQLLLELIVLDVVPLVLADDARAELLSELHHDDARLGLVGCSGSGYPALLTGSEIVYYQHGLRLATQCSSRV